MDVRVRLLGGFDVVVEGRPVPPAEWRRRSAAGLVKLLAVQPGRRLRREQVIDALWPDLLVDEAAPRLPVTSYGRPSGGQQAGSVQTYDQYRPSVARIRSATSTPRAARRRRSARASGVTRSATP